MLPQHSISTALISLTLMPTRVPSPLSAAGHRGLAPGPLCGPLLAGVLDRNQVRDQDGELAGLAARAGNPRATVVLAMVPLVTPRWLTS